MSMSMSMQTPVDSMMFETASSCGDLTALSNHASPMKPIFDENMVKNRRAAASGFAASGQQANIDTHKYRTKLCRNYVLGNRCPFEERCVFAHGEDQVRPSSGTPSPAPELNTVALTAAAMMNTTGNCQLQLAPATPPSVAITPMAMSNINSPQKALQLPKAAPCLPSYENFMTSAVSATGVYAEPASPLESRPDTPPSPLPPATGLAPFPNRFRYDPYVLGGIVFEN